MALRTGQRPSSGYGAGTMAYFISSHRPRWGQDKGLNSPYALFRSLGAVGFGVGLGKVMYDWYCTIL